MADAQGATQDGATLISEDGEVGKKKNDLENLQTSAGLLAPASGPPDVCAGVARVLVRFLLSFFSSFPIIPAFTLKMLTLTAARG